MDEDHGGGGGAINGLDSSVKVVHSSVTNLFHTGNSFELTAGASLSDDSGFVPHTNSSISSGSSSRGIGVCRFEFELAESDAEVSQFDSLDNFSDGGMSAENYNTLKKGPLAPIEPPPEFQDSPQTTLMRSHYLQNYSFRLTKAIISNAILDYSQLSINSKNSSSRNMYFETSSDSNQTTIVKGTCKRHGIVQKKCRQHLYGSDSLLDQYDVGDNIYDEPNSDFYDNHLLYSNISAAGSNNRKRNLTPVGSYKRRRTPTSSVLYSPLHHHHHHYYHTGSSNSTGNRPNSRNSLNSRLSSSHNSLSVPTANKADDSIFITQAMSHDALVGRGEISDLYNVPIDSDIYALPVDSVSSRQHNTFSIVKQHKKKSFNSNGDLKPPKAKPKYTRNKRRRRHIHTSKSNTTNLTSTSIPLAIDKRHSVPENRLEPMHMTLDEVKRYYHTLYSSSSESGHENVNNNNNNNTTTKKEITTTCAIHHNNNRNLTSAKMNGTIKNDTASATHTTNNNKQLLTMKTPTITLKSKKIVSKELAKTTINNNTIPSTENVNGSVTKYSSSNSSNKKSQFSITFNLRQKFCNIFRFKNKANKDVENIYGGQAPQKHLINGASKFCSEDKRIQLSSRALPPLPNSENGQETQHNTIENEVDNGFDKSANEDEKEEETRTMDFAANIEKVKEYGWYWGPISSEAAEKILSNEPDGSFIVRDSSDDHYIFSLTFKLDGCVRHVRIEQDQGTFSFGSCAKFKSRTIMEFIENAVEHSRSGRYLFFLHRRPEHGPMRVQLTNPVSRFKHIQSLQHMCRFVILKAVVRKDLIQTLPLPRRILDYLSYKNVFSEQIESDSSSQSQVYGENTDTIN